MDSRQDNIESGSNKNCLKVSSEESGQKLLRFLANRLNLPLDILHRWIRTGQIRLNGRRIKPFARIAEEDIIRLPPFAAAFLRLIPDCEFSEKICSHPDICILEEYQDIMAMDKPAGLPVQPGSGHSSSLADSLKNAFSNASYIPAPAHRLDRDTTGIVLAGKTWQKQRMLQDSFFYGKIHKEYLAWVQGNWQLGDHKAIHFFYKAVAHGLEKTAVSRNENPRSKRGMIFIHPLQIENGKSLLQVRLYTGIKHQIRAQLAYLGHPVLGDGKYGSKSASPLYLDAFRIILEDGHEICRMPHWIQGMLPTSLPDPLL